MKKIFLIVALSLVVLSCNMMRSNSPSTVEPTPSPSPVTPKKIIDVPSLLGKTRDEIKNIIGLTPKYVTESRTYGVHSLIDGYEFKDIGTATIQFENGKFIELTFNIDQIKSVILDTPEQLGDMVGVDVHGKPPTTNNTFRNEVTYDDFIINGVKVKRLEFSGTPERKGLYRFTMKTTTSLHEL